MPNARLRILDRVWIGPAVIVGLAFAAVLFTLDPAGNGPGVTVDEPFNAGQGHYLAEAVRIEGVWFLDPANQYDLFQLALNDHPPLGRLWIGLGEKLARNIRPPDNTPSNYSLARARTAPAMAFALLVFLVGCTAASWYGRPAGLIASLSLLLMPRVFGHAHIASLESFINLTYAATVLAVAHYWNPAQPPKKRTACLTGILLGLALLSKVQAIFIPIPVFVWAVWHWRLQALIPLLIWGVTGLVVFYIGWPHLWDAPVDHLLEYLGRTTDRAVLYNWYFGEQFADRSTPWHYPLVMFAVTVPLGIHAFALLGIAGLKGTFREMPREWLLLGCIVLPLLVFSLPGTPVYDGVRLFLVVFPLWAIFAGRGGQTLYRWLAQRLSAAKAGWLLAAFLTLQVYGIIFLTPCWLSYYNLAVGGLRGADKLGFERNYWSDSVTHELLRTAMEKIPPGSTIYVTPVLHQFQLQELSAQEPLFTRHNIQLLAYQGQPLGEHDYLLVYYRRANLDIDLSEGWNVITEIRRENVPLAGLYH